MSRAFVNEDSAAAQAVDNYRLPGSTLYVTLEPCSMCAGLIVHSRIARVVYGALEPKAGIVQSQGQFFTQGFLNHKVLLEGGVLADVAPTMLTLLGMPVPPEMTGRSIVELS